MDQQRIKALDGLRGLAVAAVVLFHTGATWARGAFLGVSLFFTLSGFLITARILEEYGTTGSISLQKFWSRRFRRLWPAAVLTVMTVFGLNIIVDLTPVREISRDSIAALLSVANWNLLSQETSYSDLFSSPSPLLHFWSLAVEEQFYLLYPIAAVAALRRGTKALGITLMVLFAGSLGLQLATDSHDWIYFGTFTRLSEIAAGALAAVWLTSLPEAKRKGEPQSWISVGAPFAMIAMLGSWLVVSESSTLWNWGAFSLVAVLSSLITIACVYDTPLGKV